jgi:hypothetical protein
MLAFFFTFLLILIALIQNNAIKTVITYGIWLHSKDDYSCFLMIYPLSILRFLGRFGAIMYENSGIEKHL